MLVLWWCLSTLVNGLLSSSATTATPPHCQTGVWDIASYHQGADGSPAKGRATSTRYCLLDGRVEMDEYRALSPQGGLVFAGISFHAWSEDGRAVTTLWLMVGDPGYTLLPGRVVGDSLVVDGHGRDGGGEFLERSVTTSSPNRDYRFEMDRSYDGGATWTDPFTRIEATFRTEVVPPHPTALRARFQRARGEAPVAGTRLVVLDGLAEVEVVRQGEAGAPRDLIRFGSLYGPPGQWRIVEWQPRADEFTTLERPAAP